MRDIQLNSDVIELENFPRHTAKIMIMYDQRGWAIRCYDAQGNKITTMEPSYKLGDSPSTKRLVPREEN